ncbi:MAG: sigma-54-dependent Fis family transcriptional regulator [Deltaproteobacteria bacterium]|nr:sigma-54-dependent Fis family transcriptional regulator [Deltaproteobacteria bacterium]
METILIVDDDLQLLKSFKKILIAEGYNVIIAQTGQEGINLVESRSPDLVLMDIKMPGMSGYDAFLIIHDIDPKLPLIIMTAYGTTDMAIEATKMGAFDYIFKPFDIPEILELIKDAIKSGQFMRKRIDMNIIADGTKSDVIVGQSKVMQKLYKEIGHVAPNDATVLVRGETGTGKELVARAIYQHSERSNKPFVVINCVAIPDTLLESELFGYEKGAFTGAVSRKLGKIEQANKGTVLLDEIGDMPANIQAKILRLLQEKCIERLGGRETIPVDVRIVAMTNRNLEAALAEGSFREDLYYRLKVVTLNVPPLRDRQGDIPLLTDYFMSFFSAQNGKPNPGLTEDAVAMLLEYNWPGNVRELQNTIQRVLIFSQGAPVEVKDLRQVILCKKNTKTPNEFMSDPECSVQQLVRHMFDATTQDGKFDSLMDQFGKIIIAEALKLTDGNRTNAAKLLGLTRPTLQAKIEKYNLKVRSTVG